MSRIINKYNIYYENSYSETKIKTVYSCSDISWDIIQWLTETGTPIIFDSLSYNEAYVTACCIANISTNDSINYWEEINNFELPEIILDNFKLF